MKRASVKISEGGRIVIPAEFRKALGVDVGDELILHMENDKMLLFTRQQAIAYVQEQMSIYRTDGEDRSLSEELLKERRREAKQDG